jgi:hypothetical protein
MTAIARLLEQRSVGHVHLRMERDGVAVLREAGSAKCRIARGTAEAIRGVQPVSATTLLNLSTGVKKPSVFRGRVFKLRAT